ncbi:MAG: glutamate synthase domain-containing protein 2/glutamate synthase domain-containing protein 1 [Sulfurimonas sp.]|jgi:glutamate synthase domain-containing protein 2/glutamate synthase domain-containing protein 1/glutamate synthase domain-containing protein 3
MQAQYLPKEEGLYDPELEHDACGVGFVAHLKGEASHGIVSKGIELLINLEHRGAVGAQKNSGDGAGILTQMPDKFLRRVLKEDGINLPEFGHYGVGVVFLPRDPEAYAECKAIVEDCIEELGQEFLGWRKVPTCNETLGYTVKNVEPYIHQVIVKRNPLLEDAQAFERKLFVIRKYIHLKLRASTVNGTGYFYMPSMSHKTISYKGQLITEQLPLYFPDLNESDYESAIALVHSRFSTNTFPSWPLAQPFRYIAHNGEINTLRGNINWMRARQSMLKSKLFSEDELEKIYPFIINDVSGSDSSVLDNVIELLTLGGRPLTHVMMMMIPEAWKSEEMDESRRAFYEYHATFMEPWDGPASVAFTDGTVVGATLDRNGLRPSRYCLTKDNILVMASEQGALEFPPEDIVLKGRLQPGKMFLADLEQGRIISDDEIKASISGVHNYAKWIEKQKINLDDLKLNKAVKQPNHETILQRQKCFGYTQEDLKVILTPMANTAYEAIGSMGNDAALSVLSNASINLYNYFHQLFAQVTNPPIDPIREESVMSLISYIGPQGNLFQEVDEDRKFIKLNSPILTNEQFEKLNGVNEFHFRSKKISILFDSTKLGAMKEALDSVIKQSSDAVKEGYEVIILSTRGISSEKAAIPTLLATSAVHHHLISEGIRTNCGLVIETGEARSVHHFATLIGYGANAINPYLAFESIEDMRSRKLIDENITHEEAIQNYISAIGKGIYKVMSKMGISTIRSYTGAQIFEAVGLSQNLVDNYFKGTPTRIEGIDIDTIEEETLLCHNIAFPRSIIESNDLPVGGHFAYRQRGENHLFTPETIFLLQNSTKTNNYEVYKQYAKLINEPQDDYITLRSLLDFKKLEPIDISEVEAVESIITRFATGAMSYGSISEEAHTTLAIAMNSIGAKSNTGEGGEDSSRFGTNKNSKIKQVASGRFGVTANYLVNAEEIQIKLAQGAKPGEGGQLPGHKVDEIIGRTRHSTPGVGLISPPPHHDIYSIEDLKQLIHDLKNANNQARINTKLVSEIGVGTIAAGVAKAHSDVILISGYDGGTGASAQTSIKHAGLPWELGLAETHQTLVKNGLRSRIVLQTDGQLRTGRDIAIATLLGAEEWGIATAALIVEGCVMMRKCHLNTCPVGIATQDKSLRAKYKGNPEHIVNYIKFIAEELREVMAELGFRTINEMVGRTDKLTAREGVTHWKAKHLQLSKLLHRVHLRSDDTAYNTTKQDHGLEIALDNKLIELAQPALSDASPIKAGIKLRNINRTVGTMLSAEVTRKYGEKGLPEDTIYFKANGSGGQSFGAFVTSGITFEVEGDANDYFGKGLCGGKLILYPPRNATYEANENVILGNVSFYGATSGEAYIYGLAGERFAVRNSGANVVVGAVGDHGCEYMTGGRVVILGEIGKNFAAGMSGGIAYIYDKNNNLSHRINKGSVDIDKIETDADNAEVKAMIENYLKYTGSKEAQEMLDNWQSVKTDFIKVMPVDYKRVLKEQAQKKEEV